MTPGAVTGGRRSRRALTALVLLAVLAIGAWVLYPRRVEVLDALGSLHPLPVLLSTVATAVGVVVTAQVWRTWLRALGEDLPLVTAHRLFYVTQSAKYLPGGLWPVAAQAAVSRRFGVPGSAMVAAASLFLLSHVVTGAAVGLALLGTTAGGALAVTSQLLAVVGLALLSPPGIRLVMATARRLRLPVTLPVPTWGAVARAVALMLLAWGCYGVALLALARAAGADDVGLLLATGTFATAWTVGFLALAVPAGIGVRESVVVAALVTGGAPEAAAIAVAVVSRAVFTVVDLLLALGSVGVMGGRGEGTTGSPGPVPQPGGAEPEDAGGRPTGQPPA